MEDLVNRPASTLTVYEHVVITMMAALLSKETVTVTPAQLAEAASRCANATLDELESKE